jgi:putative membrane protein insertion efficiency factor
MPLTQVSSVSSTRYSIAPPGLAARGALALIRAYKYLLSPWFTGACRFVPSCADYTAEAIARHGFIRGSWLGARRLSRCHPFGGHGHDPVPQSLSKP